MDGYSPILYVYKNLATRALVCPEHAKSLECYPFWSDIGPRAGGGPRKRMCEAPEHDLSSSNI